LFAYAPLRIAQGSAVRRHRSGVTIHANSFSRPFTPYLKHLFLHLLFLHLL
jgi:hypothetical protein